MADRASPLRRIALWGAVLALLAVAFWPVLTRSHVEGFSYFTETLSTLVPDIGPGDPLWALGRDYFYLSRPGVVWALAPLSDLFPGHSYNLLMWLTMPVFLSGMVVVARVASGASWLSCVATLLVLPIAIEANFFNNDNLLAVSLSLWTTILLLWRPGMATIFVAGALYSLAVLCRLDQVLLAPFFGVLVILHAPRASSAALRVVSMAAGFFVVHGLFALLDPQAANPFARIAAVTEADALWDRSTSVLLAALLRDASAVLLAVGVGLPAIAAGAIAVVRRAARDAGMATGRLGALRAWALPGLLIGYPVFVYALTLGKYYDPRALMTLLPMLAPLAAMGLQRWVFGPLLGAERASSRSPAMKGMMAALLVLPCLVPGVPLLPNVLPLPPETENAPPTLTGRIWYGAEWRDWQEANFHAREAAAEAFVDNSVKPGGPSGVLTTDWNDDRRLQYVLAARGFAPADVPEGPCQSVAELWTHPDGASLLHVRTHVPFLLPAAAYTAALYLTHGADCMATLPPDARYLVHPEGALVVPVEGVPSSFPTVRTYIAASDDDMRDVAGRATGILEYALPEGAVLSEAVGGLLARAQRLLN
jgi:hypothetical protein